MTEPLVSTSPITSQPDRWWALSVSGDLDLVGGPELDLRLCRELVAHPGHGLVLDLSDVPFMDCSGLGSVLRVRNRLGRLLWLRGVQPRVQRFLRLAQVADHLQFLPTGTAWPDDVEPGGHDVPLRLVDGDRPRPE